ncbi:MAG: patatin-like phospholipase family protein [Vicinamibacteria bacterium]|nr:patatin-like phospholipase family protein [Vicinamibacteria bacterium]
MDETAHGSRHQTELLLHGLRALFGEVDEEFLTELLPRLEWVELAGGDQLFGEGERGDDIYFVISGRLRAHVADEDGQRVLGEIMRGETIGEMAIFTGEPRSASITAVRDSVLVKLSRAGFETLLGSHPLLSINVTRLIIDRLKRSSHPRHASRRPVNLCLLPITDGVEATQLGQRLVDRLGRHGRAVLLTSAGVNETHGADVAGADKSRPEDYRRLTRWLDEVEAQHDFLVFVADAEASEWSRRSIRHSDEVLLLCDANREPAVHDMERRFLEGPSRVGGATQTLVLLHPEGTTFPRGTRAWLERRPVARHFHVRPHLDRDVARLVRILSGHAIGLVFSGGGARGFAHLGVMRALEEHGVQVDYVGGTSIGGVMAALCGFDQPATQAIHNARRAFKADPTSDYNLVPMISFIRGRKLKRIIEGAIDEAVGWQPDMEDCWKTVFCIATNFSRSTEMVLTRGDLARQIRASVSIPAALPPVIQDGDLLVDGGCFNNFPTDVMGRLGVGKVIGVDLIKDVRRRQEIDEVPGNWELLRDKLRGGKKRYRLPSLTAVLLMSTILYSNSRRKQTKQYTDLYFNPEMGRVGLLEWSRFESIVELGYLHAKELLGRMSEAELAPYRD